MKAYWKASLISEVIIVGIFAVPRGPKWDKISLRAKHHAHSSPHPPNASSQNQRDDTKHQWCLHHYPPWKTAGESDPWRGTETGSKRAAALVILGQPDQAKVFQFSGTHCRVFGQTISHTYTCKRQNCGSKSIPNLFATETTVLIGPNYHHSSTVGKTEPQSKNSTSTESARLLKSKTN